MAKSRELGGMDILYFLKERTAFIRKFYEIAAEAFVERKRKIERGEAPFEWPYFDESSSGEPPYLEEWIESDDSLHILAYNCVSTLAAALHLYFKTWQAELGKPVLDSFKAEFKSGWFAGYKAYVLHHLNICFEDSPANLQLIEEVLLARNCVQHPDSITDLRNRYSAADLKKLTHPLFLDNDERRLLGDLDEELKALMAPPTLHVTGEKLIATIEEVDKFCDWLEDKLMVSRRK